MGADTDLLPYRFPESPTLGPLILSGVAGFLFLGATSAGDLIGMAVFGAITMSMPAIVLLTEARRELDQRRNAAFCRQRRLYPRYRLPVPTMRETIAYIIAEMRRAASPSPIAPERGL